ncbi:MAG: hypothetical protein HYU39_08405 [Thaumarchaeota archaeon]|nr:hypothetical protein [Nitrososphaerota archaeon]
MAIAKLSRAVLVFPRSELGTRLTELCGFAWFHPSEREGLVDDPFLLIKSSRALSVYSEAGELLAKMKEAGGILEDGTVMVPQRFEADDLLNLVDVLTEAVREIKKEMEKKELGASILEYYGKLRSIRETALGVFNNIRRFKVSPGTRRIVVVEGFIPSHLSDSFKEKFREYLVALEPVEKSMAQGPYVPSLLVNPGVISIFENITLVQGSPRYSDIDPTPIIAVVFPLFFGFMFGDVGHGLLMLTFGLGLVLRERGKLVYWGKMLAVFGSSALLFGTIYGTVFSLGFDTPIQQIVSLPRFSARGFSMESALLLMQTAIVIGTVHLATAYALAVANQVRSRNYLEAFLGHLPTLLLYASSIAFALAFYGAGFRWDAVFVNSSPVALLADLLGWKVPLSSVASISFPVMAASFLTLLLGRPAACLLNAYRRDVLEVFAEGLLDAILRPIEFLANTLSYVRMGVLLILSTLVASLVTRTLDLGPVGIPLFVAGNLGLMVIEGLVVVIQDLRLHVYEWLSKFYFGFGTPFTPLIPDLLAGSGSAAPI